MQALLKEYRTSLKLTKQMRENAPEEDHKFVGGMATSLQFTIDWLRDGREPVRNKVAGSYPSEAISTDIEDWHTDFIDPHSQSAFEDVENRIDAERRKKHAKRG